MMLRMTNMAGVTIYPDLKSPTTTSEYDRKGMLEVFVPMGDIVPFGEDGAWACTIENANGAVVIQDIGQLARLITALEIAFEKVKTRERLD